MDWREAVEKSKKGIAVTMFDSGELFLVMANGMVTQAGSEVWQPIDETLGGAMDWSPLGERADPLSRIRKGSAIEFVCEMGKRLDRTIGDRTSIKDARLYALEMLVATAIVQFRNITVMDSVPMDDDARGVFARECAERFLGEVLRYHDGADAKPAPTMAKIGDGGL